MKNEHRWALRLLLIATLSGVGYGQQTPTVTFTLDFPGANPGHYEIVVGSDGEGTYKSDGKINDQSDPAEDGFTKFTASQDVRSQIFDLAKKAHYFSGKVDSGHKNLANTGNKTLAYKDATHNLQATYNFSLIQPVAQLTALFQGLSTTLELGRRLAYFHKYQKLGLDDELKSVEELQKSEVLTDVPAIAPVLKEIAEDSSVMNVSRARALRLLAATRK
ncbi:MAG TPA: hypothetical protein VFA85_03475 [Terriglobales bacterium]|nr:hypothetical protein [Terriglobales bacterium]